MAFTYQQTLIAFGFGAVSGWIAIAPSVEAGQPEREIVHSLPTLAREQKQVEPPPESESEPVSSIRSAPSQPLEWQSAPTRPIKPSPSPPATPVSPSTPPASDSRLQFQGLASWYGPGFHGRRAASGEIFNQNALTAAHRTLPFDTQVRVTNLGNGRSTIVRITDRGPFVGDRVLDLSRAAARELGMLRAGVVPVRVEVLAR